MKRHRAAGVLKGVLLTLGLLAILELVLRSCVEPVYVGPRDPGLDPGAAYLAPVPGEPGVWRTQFADMQREEQTIPRHGDARRVIFLGGSNAAAFGEKVPRAALDRVTEPGRYEVFNLGRNGYGTDRVALVLSQVLRHTEPDVVVLYTGDLEFLESAPRIDRSRTRPLGGLPPWMRGFRTVQTFARLLGRASVTNWPPPEPITDVLEDFVGDADYDETLWHFENLRVNLRNMIRRARESGVDAVVCTVVYNRWSSPIESWMPADLDPADAARWKELRDRIDATMPEFLGPLLPDYWDARVRMPHWRGRFGGDDTLDPDTLPPGLRESSGPLASQPPMFPDARLRSDNVHALYAALEELYASVGSPALRPALLEMEALLEEALAIHPRHSRTLFELGLVALLLERDDERVIECLEDAATYELVPRKANRLVNDVIREVAAESPEVLLFDADALMSAHVPMGLVGWEWMLDHCHMQEGARRYLSDELARRIAERWP